MLGRRSALFASTLRPISKARMDQQRVPHRSCRPRRTCGHPAAQPRARSARQGGGRRRPPAPSNFQLPTVPQRCAAAPDRRSPAAAAARPPHAAPAAAPRRSPTASRRRHWRRRAPRQRCCSAATSPPSGRNRATCQSRRAIQGSFGWQASAEKLRVARCIHVHRDQ